MQDKYIVALEIGSSKIRGAVGVVDGSGIVDVVATEEEKLTGSVRYGCIQNVEVSNALTDICERLEGYPNVNPGNIVGVYVGLGGRSLASRTVEVDITLPSEQEITTDVIQELARKAAAKVGDERELVEVIPVRFTVDGKSQRNPVGSYGHSVGAVMTVLCCSANIKKMVKRVIQDRMNLDIVDYVTRPIAEGSMVLTDEERRLGCMLVDFGAETTTVVIYKGGSPVYLATIPMGSRNITLDLTSLNYTEERAEKIKIENGNAMVQDSKQSSSPDGIDYTLINNYIHARCAEIIANILAQVVYAGMKTSELPEGIIVIGGGARLKGFNEMLVQLSKMKVRQGSTHAAVRISDGSIRAVDAIDVISILAEAAKAPKDALCVKFPEIAEKEEPTHQSGSYEDMYADEEQPEEPVDFRNKNNRPEEDYNEDSDDTKKKKGGVWSSIYQRLVKLMDDDNNSQEQ